MDNLQGILKVKSAFTANKKNQLNDPVLPEPECDEFLIFRMWASVFLFLHQ